MQHPSEVYNTLICPTVFFNEKKRPFFFFWGGRRGWAGGEATAPCHSARLPMHVSDMTKMHLKLMRYSVIRFLQKSLVLLYNSRMEIYEKVRISSHVSNLSDRFHSQGNISTYLLLAELLYTNGWSGVKLKTNLHRLYFSRINRS